MKYLKETETSGGLVIPNVAQEPQGFGEVLSVGELIDNINAGDVLVFHVRAGMDLIMDETILKCLKYEEVYGILDDPELVKRLKPIELKATADSGIVKPRGGVIVAP